MNIKIEYFDKLPKCYQNVVMELKFNLNYSKTLEEKRKLFEEFQKQYSMIPPILSLWIEMDSRKHFDLEDKAFDEFPCSKFLKDYHFHDFSKAYIYHSDLLNLEDLIAERYYNSIKKIQNEIFIPDLSYPHDCLKLVLKHYDEISCDEIRKEILRVYQKNQSLYNELINTLNDSLKFFETALKAGNKKSIEDNLELILGDHPYCVELWKKCFEYFEKNIPSKVSSPF